MRPDVPVTSAEAASAAEVEVMPEASRTKHVDGSRRT